MVSVPSPADTLFGHMRIGLGCMGLSGLFGHVERSVAIKTIHKAIDCGIRHFDTAELYGPFIGEEILAEAISQSCLLYTSPSPRDRTRSRMPSSA